MEKIKPLDNYNDAVSYILEIPRFSSKNEPEVTKDFLKLVGENKDACVIHVAGTNGKGSVCAFLDSVHRKLGKKTGLFTSPHLVDIRERICIDGQMISKEDFLECTNYVLSLLNVFNGDKGEYHPSFFEFVFFIAVRYFSVNSVQVEIFETGLGGRLDATNALSKKDVCVITSIGLDHMEYLGDTISDIAGEKAGIIKPGVPVVYFGGKNEADKVIENAAEACGCKCFKVEAVDADILRTEEKNIDFLYKYGYDNNNIFSVQTYAHYQVLNACVCLKTLQVLYGEDIVLDRRVGLGIRDMYWPGRMEEIEPGVFVDGGHNVDGVSAFIESVRSDGYDGRRILLFSAVSDKQVDVMGRMLVESGLFSQINICRINNGRATETEQLKRIIEDSIRESGREEIGMKEYVTLEEAYDDMISAKPADFRMYICGSLYLVGAVREYIEVRHD